MGMDITTATEGTTSTVKVAGKITVQTAPQLKTAVTAVPDDVCDIDIDVTDVTYISSAGLRVLVLAAKMAMGRGGTMRLLHPSEDVMEVLSMTGLSSVLTVVD